MTQTRIKYFASLREQIGRSEDLYQQQETMSLAELWLAVQGTDWPEQLRGAVNQELAYPEDTVSPGDEVAFFPPVTGG